MSTPLVSELYPDSFFYHEGTLWLQALPGDEAVIGLTHFAQQSLSPAVRVELPGTGISIAAGQSFGLIEASKTAYDLIAPASGTIVEVNARLAELPGLVNDSPHAEGWLLRVRLAMRDELDALMSAERYIARFNLSA